VPPTSLCVAWRADDPRPVVLGFVKVAAGVIGVRGVGGVLGGEA